ncbi:MAG: HAD family phosphatase [Anaerolineae bacterium]|nr:HAD family phosphatase [Anaerolineae bacterium]
MIRAIIWDLGGVLVKLGDFASHRCWEKRLGLQSGQLVEVVHNNPLNKQALIGQITAEDFWLDVGKQLDLSPEDVARLQTDFHKAGVWDERLLALIQRLKPRFKMAVISGAMSDARRIVQSQVDSDLFDVLVFSAEEGVQKPDPVIYQRTLSCLGVAAQEAIFIDDWLASVEGARRVGMHGVHYVAGVDVKAEIERIIAQES